MVLVPVEVVLPQARPDLYHRFRYFDLARRVAWQVASGKRDPFRSRLSPRSRVAVICHSAVMNTTLNQTLRTRVDKNIAVIEHEFAAIDIDGGNW